MKNSMFKYNGISYLYPFILVTSLFFLWGFAHGILDVLNKHFQDVLVITKTRSALVQAAVYGAYFLTALPAGYFIRRFGYKRGIIAGLILYAVGALLFIPGSRLMNFGFFIFSLFVIGSGLTFLETSANPYITILGSPNSAASRLNLSQSFNGLGWICGPLIGSLVILNSNDDRAISLPYLFIAIAVFIVSVCIYRVPLPDIKTTLKEDTDKLSPLPLWRHKHFVFGLIALFFYVAAQTGINSFFINYTLENVNNLTSQQAGFMLSIGGMGLFMIGRFAGSFLMRSIAPQSLLAIFAILSSILTYLVIMQLGWISIIALISIYLFESIMFPTIFALSINGLKQHTQKASSLLVMSIVGGAIAPLLMGIIGEQNMANGFIVPFICFVVIIIFSLWVSIYCNKSK